LRRCIQSTRKIWNGDGNENTRTPRRTKTSDGGEGLGRENLWAGRWRGSKRGIKKKKNLPWDETRAHKRFNRKEKGGELTGGRDPGNLERGVPLEVQTG